MKMMPAAALSALSALCGAAWFAFGAQSPSTPGSWRDQGVLYLDHSLNARLHAVPIQAVRMGEGFWSSRRRITSEKSLPTLLLELEAHGVVDNFRRLVGHSDIPRKGRISSDSDLYKWIEAASWALASNETSATSKSELKGDIESLITHILAAQDPSGYLDTYFVGDRLHLRLTDLVHSHEDYCLGHLLQAGIAYYRATGSRRLLDPGIRFADFVVQNFGPEKKPFITGHPELEMALVELYRTTGETTYLDFARYLFSGQERERLKLKDSDIRYMFSGRPFTSHTEFEGHAVRALYAVSGATDYYMESGDPAYKKTLNTLWADLTMRKMYITGGVGARAAGESFGDAYELPAQTAYAETCASVANVMWNFRMLMMTGDARYADLLERALYNGANAGMSLSGNLYCYRNPLAANANEKLRNPWYDVTCCPPNIQRLFESLPGYLFGISRDGLYVNLYHNSELNWRLEDGIAIKLTQTTDYPWNGTVKLNVAPARPTEFTLNLRWPAWASAMSLEVNGSPYSISTQPGSYVPISRTWQAGDTVTLSFPLASNVMTANPRVTEEYGRVALQRGPLVYALEQIDQGNAAMGDIFFRNGAPIAAENRRDLLGGVTVLKTTGQVAEKSLSDEVLYQPNTATYAKAKRTTPLTFIPFYALGNREASAMEVWVPLSKTDQTSPVNAGINLERRPDAR
jgi:uncharacterized protein